LESYYSRNKEKWKIYRARSKVKNRTKWKEVYGPRARLKNKEKRQAYMIKWRAEHPDYEKNRRKNDIQFKLTGNLRSRLNIAIKTDIKKGSAIKDLGCSVQELKQYLETKFQPDMSWDNWNLYGWHIDHIIPLSKFDLTNREQFLKACHFSNLQPLWAKDNLNKAAN